MKEIADFNYSFSIKQNGAGKFSVLRTKSKKQDNSYYCIGVPQEVVETVLLEDGLDPWNASYLKEYYEYVLRNKHILLEKIERINEVSIDALEFAYIRDSLGTGWDMGKAYKLKTDVLIDMWLKGAAFRFGVLQNAAVVKKAEVHHALSSAIDKCIMVYGGKSNILQNGLDKVS